MGNNKNKKTNQKKRASAGHNLRANVSRDYNETISEDETWEMGWASLTASGAREVSPQTAGDCILPLSALTLSGSSPPSWFNDAMTKIVNKLEEKIVKLEEKMDLRFNQLKVEMEAHFNEKLAEFKKEVFDAQQKRFTQFEERHNAWIAADEAKKENKNELVQKLTEEVAALKNCVGSLKDCVASHEKKRG